MTVGRIPSVEGGIQPTLLTTKGDLISATAASTVARLAVGANDTMLVADSTAATGLAWRSTATQFPWASYTPTTGGITLGNGSLIATTQYIGKTTHINITFVLGSTSAITGDVRFSLPRTAAQYSGGTSWSEDSGGVYATTCLVNYTDAYVRAISTNATYAGTTQLSSTVPFTWGAGDFIILQSTYQAA